MHLSCVCIGPRIGTVKVPCYMCNAEEACRDLLRCCFVCVLVGRPGQPACNACSAVNPLGVRDSLGMLFAMFVGKLSEDVPVDG